MVMQDWESAGGQARLRGRRKAWAAAAAAAMLAAAFSVTMVSAGQTPARAQGINLAALCTGGAGTTTFSPGINDTSQGKAIDATMTNGTLTGCLSLVSGLLTGVTQAKVTWNVTGTGFCSETGGSGSFPASGTATATITWENSAGAPVGTPSVVTGSLTFSVSTSGVTAKFVSPKVTSGPFAGDAVSVSGFTAAANLADCLTAGGVTSAELAVGGVLII
jgi:hypothetical protein